MIYSKINASKFGKFKTLSICCRQEIIPHIRSAKKAIILDVFTPKKEGIVIIFFESYSTSLMSKGIVIAKTNKKSDINWQKIF